MNNDIICNLQFRDQNSRSRIDILMELLKTENVFLMNRTPCNETLIILMNSNYNPRFYVNFFFLK